MDRRNFLRFLGLGVAAAAAPTKAYSFLGGILRPRQPSIDDLHAMILKFQNQQIEKWVNPILCVTRKVGEEDPSKWIYSYTYPPDPILLRRIT